MDGESSRWTKLWADAFRIERSGVDVRAGLAGAIASSAPLAIGVATGHGAIGSVACFGGLNASLAVPRGLLRFRLGWGVGTGIACVLAVIATTAAQASAASFVALAFVWIFFAALLRTFGATGGLTGFITSAMIVIIGGIPPAPLDVGQRALWFLAGTVLGTVLMTLAYGSEPNDGLRAPSTHDPRPLPAILVAGTRHYGECLLHDAPLRAHATRLAITVALATLIYRAEGLQHGYWIPLTVLTVLQPDPHASDVRAIQRASGTLVGAALIGLVTALTGAQGAIIALQGVAAFALFALFARGYFWLVVMLTPVALLTVSAVDYQGTAVALERAGWSALGIVGGLAVGELAWQLGPNLPTGRRPWSSTGGE
ncbi:MAG TPA: FUSC family protein [Conexibacter sp.]|jgi:hypothetical protein